MRVLGIVGAGAAALCDRLAVQLDDRVATVESLLESATEPESTDDVAAAYGLSSDGNWVGSSDGRDLDGLLSDLSAEYNYALLSGPPGAHVPMVALAGIGAANVVVEAEAAGAIDVASFATEIDSHEPHIMLETLVEHAKADSLEIHAGAIATFIGRAHAKEPEDDDPTLNLELEKYDGVAGSKVDTISEELEVHDGILRALMHHRVGVVEDSADIVFVVALVGHRQEAFRAVKDDIDCLKDEVPIFKKETTADEEFWTHDR